MDDALNRTRFLTDFTTFGLKGFFSVALGLTICSRVYGWWSIFARSYDYVPRNIKRIVVVVFIVCAYLSINLVFWQFFHFYGPGKHKQDLTTLEPGMVGSAVNVAFTSTVGYCLYWLLTQGD